MWWLYALVGVLALVVLFLAVFAVDQKAKCRGIRESLKEEQDNSREVRKELNQKIDNLQGTIDRLYNENLSLKGELGETKVTAQGELHTADIQEEINRLANERTMMQERLLEYNYKLIGVALTQREFYESLARSKEMQLIVENTTHDLEKRNQELVDEQQKLNGQVNELNRELQKLLAIQKVVETNEDNVIWDPILNEKQAKLVSILHDLILMYPDLSLDFASIEWKKIWMPQLQGLGSLIDGKRGVYRLILKDNSLPPLTVEREGSVFELPVCYVGQAVNIKDRWYQHVKKMIGVMPKGNEKLYDWRPEQFKWCIVEEGKDVDLDKSEKYWIGYFAAKEGLNKKVGNN